MLYIIDRCSGLCARCLYMSEIVDWIIFSSFIFSWISVSAASACSGSRCWLFCQAARTSLKPLALAITRSSAGWMTVSFQREPSGHNLMHPTTWHPPNTWWESKCQICRKMWFLADVKAALIILLSLSSNSLPPPVNPGYPGVPGTGLWQRCDGKYH